MRLPEKTMPGAERTVVRRSDASRTDGVMFVIVVSLFV